MSHTYTSNFVHCIFSTKQRAAIIPADRKDHLWAYLLGIARNMKIKTLAIGGTSHHLHLLIALPSTMNLAKVVCDMKANSSKWLNEAGLHFAWQEGYGAFSVSPSPSPRFSDTSAIRPSTTRKKFRAGVRGPASKIGNSVREEVCVRLMSPRWGSVL
jgi:putative transposase